MTKPTKQRRWSKESGSTILEFAIVAPFLMLAFFWTAGLGIMLGRYIQAVQVCRDLAHMYSDGVDFSQTTNKNIAVQLAQGTGMTAAGGNGVVMFSKISTVYQADCDAAGYSNNCNNRTLAVFTQRVYVGNTGLRNSSFGTPASAILDAQGNIAGSVYLQNTDASTRTSGFTPLLTAAGETQAQGNTAWVVEVFFSYPDISFLGASTAGGAYSRFIF